MDGFADRDGCVGRRMPRMETWRLASGRGRCVDDGTGAPGLGMLIPSAGDMRETELPWAAAIPAVLVAVCVLWATPAGKRALLAWRQ